MIYYSHDITSYKKWKETIDQNAYEFYWKINGSKKEEEKMNKDSKIKDLLNIPEFKEYGRFLFPEQMCQIDDQMTLNDIQSLMPYHNYFDFESMINVLQYLKKESENRKVYYPIYSQSEMDDDPSKKDAGVFFFKGEANQPFAIVCPGGAFKYVGSLHEGLPLSLYLSSKGYNVFCLQYRCHPEGNDEMAMADMEQALSYIIDNKDMFAVSVRNYSVWGASAGAVMAAKFGAVLDHERPCAVIMEYTKYAEYSKIDPPTFCCIGENDRVVRRWQVMEWRCMKQKELGVITEFHKYPELGHGFGLGLHTPAEGWADDAIRFWNENMIKEDNKDVK